MIAVSAVLELDQHTGRARLIDVGLREPQRRRPVRVPVKLAMQLLGLHDERVGLLAQPQRRQLALVDGGQVGAERTLRRVAQRLPDRSRRVANQLRPRGAAVGDRGDDRRGELR